MEDLTELKIYVLEAMRGVLVKNIDPRKFLPFLRSHAVLNDWENSEIKSCCARSVLEGADKFIDVLRTKGDRGYDMLCQALFQDQTQLYLLTALNKSLELLRYSRREQVARMMAAQQEQQRLMQPHQQPHQHHQQPHQHHQGDIVPPSAHTTSCLRYTNSPSKMDPYRGSGQGGAAIGPYGGSGQGTGLDPYRGSGQGAGLDPYRGSGQGVGVDPYRGSDHGARVDPYRGSGMHARCPSPGQHSHPTEDDTPCGQPNTS